MKKFSFVVVLLLVFFSGPTERLFAEDTGKVITGLCRQNLKMLNEGTRKFLSENDSGIPMWSKYDTIKTSLMDYNYYPKDPVSPTRDCHYFLVSVSRDDYQWYCDLHGVLDGEKTVTFQYHEHRLMAKTSSRYAHVPKYAEHVRDLLRWTDYNATPTEKFKYYYNMNPLTTIILLVGGTLLLLFVYRNMN